MSEALVNYVIEKIGTEMKPISFISHVIVGTNLKMYEIRFVMPKNEVYRAIGYVTDTALYACSSNIFKVEYPDSSLKSIADIQLVGSLSVARNVPLLTTKDVDFVEKDLLGFALDMVTEVLPNYRDMILDVRLHFNPTAVITIIVGSNQHTFGSIAITRGRAFKCFGTNSILDEIVGVINEWTLFTKLLN